MSADSPAQFLRRATRSLLPVPRHSDDQPVIRALQRHPCHGRRNARVAQLHQQFGSAGNALRRVIFLDRFARGDHRKDRIVPIRHRRHVVYRPLGPRPRPNVASVLAHGAFRRRFRIRQVAFHHDLGFRRHLQVHRLAAHHFDRAAEVPAHIVGFADLRRQRHRRDKRNERRTALKDGERHGLADLLPHSVNLAQVLQRVNDPGQPLPIHQHDPRNTPIGPRFVRSLRHHRGPGSEVAAAVAVVNQRNRETKQVDRVSRQNMVFARPARHDFGRNEFALLCRH